MRDGERLRARMRPAVQMLESLGVASRKPLKMPIRQREGIARKVRSASSTQLPWWTRRVQAREREARAAAEVATHGAGAAAHGAGAAQRKRRAAKFDDLRSRAVRAAHPPCALRAPVRPLRSPMHAACVCAT